MQAAGAGGGCRQGAAGDSAGHWSSGEGTGREREGEWSGGREGEDRRKRRKEGGREREKEGRVVGCGKIVLGEYTTECEAEGKKERTKEGKREERKYCLRVTKEQEEKRKIDLGRETGKAKASKLGKRLKKGIGLKQSNPECLHLDKQLGRRGGDLGRAARLVSAAAPGGHPGNRTGRTATSRTHVRAKHFRQ